MPVVDIETSVSPAEIAALRTLAAGRDVLELGSWYGFSTVMLAQVARYVDAVDWHRGDANIAAILGPKPESLPIIWANLTRYGVFDKVTLHVGLGAVVLPRFAPALFDVAFIDGFHLREQCLRDIADVVPHMRPGAYVCFHDYGVVSPDTANPFGITEAVNEWCATGAATFVELVETLAVTRLP